MEKYEVTMVSSQVQVHYTEVEVKSGKITG